MMNRMTGMNTASRPACTIDSMAYYAFTNAACFSVLRFYFYCFTDTDLSKRKQIS